MRSSFHLLNLQAEPKVSQVLSLQNAESCQLISKMADKDPSESQEEKAAALTAAEAAAAATAEKTKMPPGPPAGQPGVVEHPAYEFALAVLVPVLIMMFMAGMIWKHELFLRPIDDGTAGTRDKAVFSLEEASIAGMQYECQAGRLSSKILLNHYLTRIKKFDLEFNSVLETNPDAFHIADDKDMERYLAGQPMEGLHGISVLLNDNIGTKDRLNTTAGALALVGSVVPRDATVTALLREAGAVVLGKSNTQAWGGFRATGPPAGWISRGGIVKNPYALSASPCGASGGAAVAVAANLVAVALGTETDGGLLCAAGSSAVVAIKPTVGLTSRAGLVPGARSLDSVGPLARTMEDAVTVLDAIVARQVDPRDPATSRCQGRIPPEGYNQFLLATGASGKRIGVARSPFWDPSAGLLAEHELAAHEAHVETLRGLGAEVVDHADLNAALARALFHGTETFPETAEQTVVLHEFKEDIAVYLRELEESPHGRSLADLLAFEQQQGEAEPDKSNPEFLRKAEETAGTEDKKYKEAKQLLAEYTRDGIDRLFADHELDVLIGPTSSQIYRLAAIAGYPGISIPAGYSPPGLDAIPEGVPFGLTFIGPACTEPTLIEIAFAFEQATTLRKPPFEVALDQPPSKCAVQLDSSKEQGAASGARGGQSIEAVDQKEEL